jgi:hypothetical protein
MLQGTHLIGFGARRAASGGTPAVISGATGTAIGNMTGGGGLASGFDGNFSQSYTAGPSRSADTGNTLGKDWGSGNTKTITSIRVRSPSDTRFNGSGGQASGYTFKLQGSADNSAYTDLGSTSGTQTGLNQEVTITATDTTTAYRYHRITCDITSLTGGFFACSELEFTGY